MMEREEFEKDADRMLTWWGFPDKPQPTVPYDEMQSNIMDAMKRSYDMGVSDATD